MSHSRRSLVGSPLAIHSATALPTPTPCVIQTACADQNPRTWGASPSTGNPSVVNEKRPLNLRVNPTPLRLGNTSTGRCHRFLKVRRRKRHLGRSNRRFLVVENVIGIH